MSLNFRANADKAIEAIVYIATKHEGISDGHIGKVIFYAEKEHLNIVGRPIIGDSYIKMVKGPVPSLVRNIIHGYSRVSKEVLHAAGRAFQTIPHQDPKYLGVYPRRGPKLGSFSRSELRAIDNAIEKYAFTPWDQLSEGTHQLREWESAILNRRIDAELIIDKDNPHKDQLLRQVQEFALYGAL